MKKANIILILFFLILGNSCSNADKKFVGSWKFVKLIPTDKPNDHSMDGNICTIEKYGNTKKTYSLTYLDGVPFLLTETENDENTLVGVNTAVYVKYHPETGHLSLFLAKDFEIVFSKLE
jgi:hypothetical protein